MTIEIKTFKQFLAEQEANTAAGVENKEPVLGSVKRREAENEDGETPEDEDDDEESDEDDRTPLEDYVDPNIDVAFDIYSHFSNLSKYKKAEKNYAIKQKIASDREIYGNDEF